MLHYVWDTIVWDTIKPFNAVYHYVFDILVDKWTFQI